MNRMLLSAGVAGLLALTAGTALAQGAPQRGLRADTDNDGRISRAEFVDGRLARLNAVDANRDGAVSVEERRSGIETRRNQRVSNRFARLDANGDGSLTRDEFTAVVVQADGRAPGLHRGGRVIRQARALRGARAAQPVQIAQVRTRLDDAFARLDADHDGYLTQAERQAGRQQMRERRREQWASRHATGPSRSAPASE